MKREEILRSDFPTARKGYDPAAVDAHLREVADDVEAARGSTSLADVAAEKVASIVEAAEAKAKEIEADARREADELLSNARSQARDQIERAQRSVANLVGQADELRERVGAMAREVGGGETRAETEPGPEPVPEPAPPQPEVDPTPVTVPEPTPPREPEPEPPAIPEPQPEIPPPAANGADEQAARLVAMKMALDGSSREDVAKHLAANYELADSGELLDAVFERVGK
ncbi:MAG: DivIVA domain-containing protein [Solirubrobacterales bacterium]